jgi:hypothetical protein
VKLTVTRGNREGWLRQDVGAGQELSLPPRCGPAARPAVVRAGAGAVRAGAGAVRAGAGAVRAGAGMTVAGDRVRGAGKSAGGVLGGRGDLRGVAYVADAEVLGEDHGGAAAELSVGELALFHLTHEGDERGR